MFQKQKFLFFAFFCRKFFLIQLYLTVLSVCSQHWYRCERNSDCYRPAGPIIPKLSKVLFAAVSFGAGVKSWLLGHTCAHSHLFACCYAVWFVFRWSKVQNPSAANISSFRYLSRIASVSLRSDVFFCFILIELIMIMHWILWFPSYCHEFCCAYSLFC